MKIEFKRALLNPYFVYICLIGILIAIIHSYNNIVLYKSVESNFYNMVTNGHNPYYPLFTLKLTRALRLPFMWVSTRDSFFG